MKCHTCAMVNRKSELTNIVPAGKEQKSTSNSLKILFYVCVFSMLTATVSQARDVTLQWDPSADTSVTGYKVYYNADSASIPFSGTGAVQGASPYDAKKVTTTALTGLDPARAYYFAITAYNSTGTESLYSNIVSVAEAVAPTVSITSPAANSTISGTVSVNATATDNVGVTKVEYYLNGTLKTTDTASPYVYSLDTTSLASGTYTLMAKAYDAAGNVGQSSNVSVTVVNDTTAPTVSVTAPANNATIGGTTTITASASDNVGVSKVEFYRSGVLLTATNVAPYLYSWNTTTIANGSYTLVAKAYDNSGNVAQSANVIVTVNNTVADTTAPSVAVTAPSSNATVSGTVAVTASASDNVAVSKVEFYVNGALQATDSASPFSYSWNTTLVSNGTYSIVAKAYDAAGNIGQSAAISAAVNNIVTQPAGTVTAVFGNVAGANYPNTVEDTFLKINNDVSSTSTMLSTYTWPAGKPANAILMNWDLSGLPANAQIQSATLSLYMTGSGGDAQYEIPVSAIVNKAPAIAKSNGSTYDGTNAWTASSIPYGGYPLAQSDIAPAVDAPLVDTIIGYKNWDVTGIIKGWVATSGTNRGLLLNSSSKASSDSNRVFASSETADANQRPKLVVTYTLSSDTTAPAVAISAPTGSTTVSGTVAVSATASDNLAVTKVEFYVNGALQTSDTAAPYSYSWNTENVSNGTYTLTAKAYDAAGNIGQSSAVQVNVNNDKTAPVTSITSPAAATTVSGTVTVASSASDNVAVSKVEFYVNGALQATDSASPFSFSWNTTSVGNGTYSLTSKAYDAAGNVGQSAAVSVSVNNVVADTIAPSVTITSPSAYSTVKGTVCVAVTVSDNVGVAKVEYYVNNGLNKTVTASPFGYCVATTAAYNGTYTMYAKAYDAAGNVKQSRSVTYTIKN
ncbi:MAG: Ig-like domain-containing protein [Desulfuromonadaceae bacterium]|nr:Ig-like domain-containing protein [Desulfuromonadaceae bacterium]MDD2848982.1 Ig-like domain-containing protein [Desulfuromonadaceae bacterium]MDD4130331.1 Ig-like domain-containing protein [Desulfuromonadaceae bacterium]